MKLVIACLILCSSAYSQTIHVKHDDIVYEEQVTINRSDTPDVISKLASVLKNIQKDDAGIVSNDSAVTGKSTIRLHAPHGVIRTLHYRMTVQPNAEGFLYRIDNISVTEKPRGEKSKTLPGKLLLKGLGESGLVSTETEKLLNEIDMRFQEVIARLKQEINLVYNK